MAPENRKTAEEAFRELETQLAALRTVSKVLREKRPSRAENLFHPGRRAKEEADFGAALVSALKEFGASIRNAMAGQEAKLAELEHQILEVRSEQTEVGRLRERQEQLERQAREQAEVMAATVAAAAETATKSAAELRQQMDQSIHRMDQSIQRMDQSIQQIDQSIQQMERLTREQGAKAEQLTAEQKDLANEFRERIQHLLDEQRVAIRQLALKASEDSILSDRARRATELKLEELAKRVPPAPPA